MMLLRKKELTLGWQPALSPPSFFSSPEHVSSLPMSLLIMIFRIKVKQQMLHVFSLTN